MAVYFALIQPGDTILGMNLAHGGHLTHGSPVNMSGKYFRIVPYGVRESDETIDYEALHDLAMQEKPKIIVAGAILLHELGQFFSVQNFRGARRGLRDGLMLEELERFGVKPVAVGRLR